MKGQCFPLCILYRRRPCLSRNRSVDGQEMVADTQMEAPLHLVRAPIPLHLFLSPFRYNQQRRSINRFVRGFLKLLSINLTRRFVCHRFHRRSGGNLWVFSSQDRHLECISSQTALLGVPVISIRLVPFQRQADAFKTWDVIAEFVLTDAHF